MQSVSRLIRAGAAAGALAATACARADGALSPLLAQATVDTGGGKNYIVEILVTLALFGLALWVICKSSRRV